MVIYGIYILLVPLHSEYSALINVKQFLILSLFLCSTSIFAQDVIVKKDGSTIICRVVELTSSEFTYKKWDNLKGSSYVMNRSDASAINYQNGKKVNLSEATNLYMPNNQNDGSQKYNDKSLLKMDATIQRPATYKRKAVAIGVIGCTIGAGLLGTGIYYLSISNRSNAAGQYKGMGAGLAACGVGVAAGSLLWANSLRITVDGRPGNYKTRDNQYDSRTRQEIDINVRR